MSIRNIHARPMGSSDILFQISVAGDTFSLLNKGIQDAGLKLVSSARPNLAFSASARDIPHGGLTALNAHITNAAITAHQSDNVSQPCATLVEAAQFVASGLKL